MLKVDRRVGKECIIFNNRVIFKINGEKPVAKIGNGNATYKMSRGSFKIKDKANQENYYIEKVTEESGNIIAHLKSSSKKTAKLLLREDNDLLEIKFDIKDAGVNRVTLIVDADKNEKVYGCGEQFAKFNLRGEKVKIWVQEHIPLESLLKKAFCYQFGLKPGMKKFSKYSSYMVMPTFITSDKTFIHTETDAYSEMDFSKDDSFSIAVRDIPERILIGRGKSYEELMSKLTGHIGRQEKLPDWTYEGMILGIQDGTDVCDTKMQKIVDAGGKVAGIWSQDWEGQRITAFGKQLMWDWKWDEELYKGLDKKIIEWNKKGVAFLGYINPFLAIEGELYKEASKKGYVVKNADGEDYLVKITTFPAAMIDLSNKDGYEWIKNVIKKNMIELGLKGWMADFGEYLPTDAVISGGDAEVWHNKWPMLWAKVNMEAIKEMGKEDEVMFFTRAGYTGTAKHTMLMWNGDQHVDWTRDYGIGSIVNSMMSLSVSGVGVSHSDVGGYTAFGKMRRSKELLLRWTELGAFSPVMRSHEGNRPDDCWQFDSCGETVDQIVKFSNIKYKLKDYLKECVDDNNEKGIPVVRPLFFYYDEDKAYHADDTYLLGRDILVKPVVEAGVDEADVYLPQDKWIHLWSGKEYSGGGHKIKAPIGQPPVFFRKKSEKADLFKNLV